MAFVEYEKRENADVALFDLNRKKSSRDIFEG